MERGNVAVIKGILFALSEKENVNSSGSNNKAPVEPFTPDEANFAELPVNLCCVQYVVDSSIDKSTQMFLHTRNSRDRWELGVIATVNIAMEREALAILIGEQGKQFEEDSRIVKKIHLEGYIYIYIYKGT